MFHPVLIKSYPPPPFDRREILRYCRGQDDPATLAFIEDCIGEAEGLLTYKVCYSEFPLSVQDGMLDLGFARIRSRDLQRNLQGCGSILLFAATVGIGLDRLIAKYSSRSPAKALIFQALGAERVESLCDLFCREMKQAHPTLRPRFSPGYGDLPLELQKDVFCALDCPRKIGLSLNQSLLMSPSKSVTAILGF